MSDNKVCVINEIGDLGLGAFPTDESVENIRGDKKKKDKENKEE